MKIRNIVIAAGMIIATAGAANAETLFEHNGSGVAGQRAAGEQTINYLGGTQDFRAPAATHQPSHNSVGAVRAPSGEFIGPAGYRAGYGPFNVISTNR